jgi:cation transporter-like permease
LFALGVDESTLARVLQRQQSAAAVPAVAIGALVGGAGTGYLASGDGPARIVLPTLAVAALAAAAVWLVTRLAARLLRSRLRSTLDPENLRVA